MEPIDTRNMTIEELRNCGTQVNTDCGNIEIIPYDDGIANGVKIYLGDLLVAMVDCYRKTDDKDIMPEARLLVYGEDNPDLDEPVDIILLT